MNSQLTFVLMRIALTVMSGLAWASDCSVSREFELKHSQVLRGTLQDPQGMALSGSMIELLSGKQLLRSVRTDNLGVYDFGEMQPGKYQVQLHAHAFCAPQVICKAEGCSFSSKLKLNSKSLVTVQ